MRTSTVGRAAAALALVAGAGLLAGTTDLARTGPPAAPGSVAERVSLAGQSYAVGGKEFEEQLILCQMTVALLESVGADVTERCRTGGTDVARNALEGGDLDVYWEYTGTAWITFLGETVPIPDEQGQWQAVADRDLAENGIRWIGRTPFDNTYAFAVAGAAADEYGLATLSDMAAWFRDGRTGASMCVEPEYVSRSDGLPGLQEAYGFTVPSPIVLAQGVIFQATADGDPCLFGIVNSTDGRIPQLGLRVLDDDRGYHPIYNASATVREDTYARAPQIAQVLEPLAAALDVATISELNKQVSADGRDPREVARTWLIDRGWIGPSR